MNIDLITKLAKLANNNPNEHEANLAARKVCKLLEEGDFKFINQLQPSPIPNYQPTQRQQNYYNPFYGSYRKYAYDYVVWDKAPKQASKQEPPKYYGWQDPKWNYVKPSEQKVERDLTCKTCKKIVKTKFVGLAEVFECNTCQWTAYERNKK